MTRQHDSRSAQVTPATPGTRVSTVSPRSGLVSPMYITRCPACSTYRRHQSDGLRRCGCGQLYRIVVTAVVGVMSEAVTG
jgi:hypothetical protein